MPTPTTRLGLLKPKLADTANIETAVGAPLDQLDALVPSAAQQAAMAGTTGTPDDTNRYVTNIDTRLSDQRVPRDGSVTSAKVAPGTIEAVAFLVGEIRFIAVGTPPPQWLPAQGGSYLRSQYPALFAALGGASSPWGLPDSTHFNVPDLSGRSPVGTGTGAGLSSRVSATKWGVENITLSQAQLPSHVHADGTLTVASHVHGVGTIAVANAAAIATGTESADHTHVSYDRNRSDIQQGTAGAAIAVTGWTTPVALQATTGRSAAHYHVVPIHGHGISGSTAAVAPDISGSTGSIGSGTPIDTSVPSIAIPAYIYAGA